MRTEPCGWQGADLIDFFERRWTQVDAAVFERELGATGPLEAADVSRYEVRFAAADAPTLVSLLQRLREEEAGRVFAGVADVTEDNGAVLVRLGEGPEPALQRVGPQLVACHLHGIVERDDPHNPAGPKPVAGNPASDAGPPAAH